MWINAQHDRKISHLCVKNHVILYQRQKGIAKHGIALVGIVNSHLSKPIKKLLASDDKMWSIRKCESLSQSDVAVPVLCTIVLTGDFD